MAEKLDIEDINLLEELFIVEGVFSYPNSVEDLELTLEDVKSKSSLFTARSCGRADIDGREGKKTFGGSYIIMKLELT